ncbi:MAG: YkgJ family cysteine cluster protein [Saprospiraceae bacterium]|nr:YkgJ family cysteine cluster protein [Saprospiraceae bacterium]
MNLIEDWKNRKSSARKQIRKTLSRLEREKGKKLDMLADQVHEEVFSELDCLDCANCCTSIPPMLNKTDIARVARTLGMGTAAFQEQYLRMDEDGDMVMNTSPCPFLQEDHACLIYEDRPKACRQYPHTNEMEFSQRMNLHKVNANHCPAVFHIIERINQALL